MSSYVIGLIYKFSMLYNFDPMLVAALISNESSFKACATGSAGERGLMQLMPEHFAVKTGEDERKVCNGKNIEKVLIKSITSIDLKYSFKNKSNKLSPLVSYNDLYNESINIAKGVAYLAKLRDMTGKKKNKFHFLVAYNWGYRKAKSVKNVKTTQYYTRVMSHLNKVRKNNSLIFASEAMGSAMVIAR